MKLKGLKIYSLTRTRSLILLFLVLSINRTNAQVPTWEWAKPLYTDGHEISRDVVVDQASNSVYMVGEWANSLSSFFPTGTNPGEDFSAPYGGRDGYVAKFDLDGNFIWAFKLGGPGDDFVDEIVVDASGNIYVTGYFGSGTGDAYFAGTSPVSGASTVSNTSRDDFYLAKYNSDGEFLWLKRSYSLTDDTWGQDVAVNSTGVYVAGIYENICSIGSLPITQTFGWKDIFVAKFDPDGNEQWIIVGGSNDDDYPYAIVADENNVYVVGSFSGSEIDLKRTDGATISTIPNTFYGWEDGLIFSYDSDGKFRWSESISTDYKAFTYDVAHDNDSIYITGSAEGSISFPSYSGNPLNSSRKQDIYLASMAKSTGSTGWVHLIPCTDNGNEEGNSITLDPSGEVLVTGAFREDLQFPGSVTLSSGGGEDVFVAKYSPNGSFIWAKQAGSPQADKGLGISTGTNGDIYVSGKYDGTMTLGLLPQLPDAGANNAFIAMLSDSCTDALCGTITTPQTEICEGESITITLPVYSGDIIWQWSPPGDNPWNTIPGETSPTLTVSPVQLAVEYRAYLTSGSCEPDSSNIILITKTPSPTIADAGPDQIDDLMCGLTSTTLAANTPIDGTGSWSIISGNGGTVETPASPTSNFDGIAGESYVLRWTITNDPCAPSIDELSITFIQEPTIADAGPDQIDGFMCGITSTTLAANAPTIGTGLWSIVSGNGGTVDTPASPTSNFNGIAGETYVLRWTITNAPCPPSTDEVSITFIQEPSIANAGPVQISASMCGITSTTLAANAPTIGTGSWSIISGNGGTVETPASPTSNFDGIAGESYVLRWTITNAPCTPTTDELNITFLQEPTIANAGPDQIDDLMCGITSTKLAANTPTIGTGLWSIVSGNGGTVETPDSPISDFNGIAGETYVLRWTITNAPCTPTTDELSITFIQEPTIADAGPDQIDDLTCGVTGTTLAANTPIIGTGLWSIVSGNGGTVDTPTSPTSDFNGIAGETYVLRWTITNAPCTPSTDEVSITFIQEPTIANAGPVQIGSSMCGITSTTLAANTPNTGTGLWSIVSGNGGTVDTPVSPTSGFNGIAGETYVLRWTITNGLCTPSTSDVTISFYQQPLSNAGSGGYECDLDFQLMATPSIGSGTWTMTSGTGLATFSPNANDPTAVVSVSESGIKEFTWTEINGNCNDASSITVDFLQEVTVNAGIGGEECDLNFELQAEISFGSGIWIKKSGPGDVSFSPSENDPKALVTVSEYGTYEFTWTESNGSCSGSGNLSVIFWEQPTAYAGPDQTLGTQLETTLEADMPLVGQGIWDVTNGTASILDPNDPKSSVTGLTPGENIYTWKVRNGVCIEATDEVIIFVNEMDPPTVFTPNSDGLNDELVFPGLNAYEGSSIIIYNRWGNEVYRSNKYKNDWTGKNQKQNDLQEDTYFYVLKISNGQIVKGFIEIKR